MDLSAVKNMLLEIAVVPGVTATALVDRKKGVLWHEPAAGTDKDLLQTLGLYLLRLLKMGGMAELVIRSAQFRFDGQAVLGMPLGDGSVVLTVCGPQANCTLLASTIGVLTAEFEETLEQNKVVESIPQESFPELPETAEMQPLFDRIEEALAATIGPVAGIVMQDYLARWAASGPMVTARLTELVDMLVEEIGDQELERDFREAIKTVI